MAQLGSTPSWGDGGRGFRSRCSERTSITRLFKLKDSSDHKFKMNELGKFHDQFDLKHCLHARE